MELKYIREFLSLAETGSFFETAEQLFVTTSSLSRHIRALEEELGITLFDRTTRRVSLSRQGKLFLPFARQYIEVDDACARALEEDASGGQDMLSIGYIRTMKAYGVDALFTRFMKENQNVRMDMHEADSTQLSRMLREEEIDFAILRNRNVSLEEFETVPIAQDHLVAMMPRSHRLARKTSIGMGQLKDESLLLISSNTYMHRLCTELCREAGFKPRVVFTSQRAENLVDLVQQGTGIALLMQKPVAPLLPSDLCLVDIEPRVTTTVFLAHLKEHKLNPAGKRFLNLCRAIPHETT